MTILIWMFAAALFAAGLFFLTSHILRLPSRKSVKAIAGVHGKPGMTERLQQAIHPLAVLLARLFPMSGYREKRMHSDFERLGVALTPKEYAASELAKALLLGLTGLIFIPLGLPWFALLTGMLGLISYFRSMQSIRKRVQQLDREIEAEMPRLVETLNLSFQENRDLIGVFEKYRLVSGKALGGELDRLILDLKTGNQERALKEMDSRLNLPSFSALTAALCGVHKGIDQRTSLLVLEQDLRTSERERLRREMETGEKRVKTASFILTILMIALFMIPIVLLILRNLTAAGL
jgi:hypothetical protein